MVKLSMQSCTQRLCCNLVISDLSDKFMKLVIVFGNEHWLCSSLVGCWEIEACS